MGSIGNYWFFWALYLGAAVIFSGLFWRVTRFEKAIWASYSLRAVAIAVVFTPWYSNSQDSGMAPALMVATLDAITGGFEAAFRSFVPLALAVLFSLLLASVMSFFKKK
ncbi:MAG: hypothetical protein OSB11_11400 [Gammaproteobacteria bacterium]|jgi:hypothetical protein|nr:hypothetical protein [Gammaproteobacteria bacterium]